MSRAAPQWVEFIQFCLFPLVFRRAPQALD